MMNWDDYRLVLAIAKSGGLPGAAQTLNVTISTIYRRLEKIEDSLGGPIFVKKRSGYEPNEAGEILIQHAMRIEDEISSAEREIQNQDAEISGLIRITTSEVLAPFFVARHIETLKQNHRSLDIEILSNNTTFDLANKQADIALRPTRPIDDNLFGRKLTNIHWGVYGNKIEYKDSIKFNDLSQISQMLFVGFTQDPTQNLAILEQRAKFPDAKVVIKANSLTTSANIAAYSTYLAVLPCILGEQFPGLTCMAGPMEHQFGELWIVCHKDMRKNAKIRSVFDFFISVSASDKHLFLKV